MDQVIFFINKEDDEFKFSQIIKNKTEQELIDSVAKYNSQEEKKDKVYIVYDKHVISAIIYKETYDTIKGRAKQLKEEIDEFRESIVDNIRDLERSVENMMEFIIEKAE